jgi:hypothetical protein
MNGLPMLLITPGNLCRYTVADHFSIFSRIAGICHERCTACVINLSWQRMFRDC